jgi:catalase
MKDPSAFWDFLSLVPESLHQVTFSLPSLRSSKPCDRFTAMVLIFACLQVLITFSPRGVPDGFRHMHGFGSHTFKWVNKEGKAHWVKYHFLSDQGIKNLTHERAVELAGINPDYATEDLFQNIQNGNGPSWTFKVQVMPLEDAASCRWDPFDLTKVCCLVIVCMKW